MIETIWGDRKYLTISVSDVDMFVFINHGPLKSQVWDTPLQHQPTFDWVWNSNVAFYNQQAKIFECPRVKIFLWGYYQCVVGSLMAAFTSLKAAASLTLAATVDI